MNNNKKLKLVNDLERALLTLEADLLINYVTRIAKQYANGSITADEYLNMMSNYKRKEQ